MPSHCLLAWVSVKKSSVICIEYLVHEDSLFLSALKIFCLFITWIWCVWVWVFFSLPYLEFTDLPECVGFFIICEKFSSIISSYSFCPFFPLLLGFPLYTLDLVFHKSQGALSFFFIHSFPQIVLLQLIDFQVHWFFFLLPCSTISSSEYFTLFYFFQNFSLVLFYNFYSEMLFSYFRFFLLLLLRHGFL